MNCVLAAMAQKQNDENIASFAAMLMTHLVLTRPTAEPDASRNKTTTRRLRMLLNGETEDFFKEAEALILISLFGFANNKTRDMLRDLSAEKISNALRSVNDCEKGGVLSPSEKIDKTVLDETVL